MQAERSTIGIKRSTKNKLDSYRVPGQTYEGIILEMIDLWEERGEHRRNLAHELSSEKSGLRRM